MGEVAEAIQALNGAIDDNLEEGRITPIHFEGRPYLKLVSDDPLSVEHYSSVVLLR